MTTPDNGPTPIVIFRTLVVLFSRAIVCNSNVSLEQHVALGYRRDRLVMIPNGFDLHRFRPDPDARREVRSELGVPEDAPLVGMMARRHPIGTVPF